MSQLTLLLLAILGVTLSAGFQCGFKHIGNRIVNGSPATPNNWPWAVHLNTRGMSCGGSLISQSYVLTAAHCTYGAAPHEIRVSLGCHDIRSDCKSIMNGRANIPHPQYSFPRNDIALVQLNGHVALNQFISPVCLSATPARMGTTLTTIGWGRTYTNSNISPILMTGNMRVVNDNQCRQKYNVFHHGLLCGANASGSTICQGDSGGFVGTRAQRDGRRWVQMGVVCFAEPTCPVSQLQGVTEVADYRSWISSYVRDAGWI